MKNRRYSDDEIKYLKGIIPGRSHAEIADMFNKRFELHISVAQVKSFINNRGLSTGRTGRFEKGHASWNKGMKGLNIGGKETQFKKGNRPHNYKPVGTERINGDGYVDIKVADPNKWRGKHILIWEEHNGPIPAGHAVIFGDGNNRNFDPNNLILVSRRQLVVMNRKALIYSDANSTRTGAIMADIRLKIAERKKKGRRDK